MAVKKLPRVPLPRTLRGRLIAGLVALLAAGCATVGLVTYLAVERTLSRELNSELQTATGLAYNCWDHPSMDGNDGSGSQPLTNGNDGTSGAHGGTGLANGAPATTANTTHQSASPSAASSPAPATSSTYSKVLANCQGLGERTFVAVLASGRWSCDLIGGRQLTLSHAQEHTLLSIKPWPLAPGNQPGGQDDIPTTTRYLSWAGGNYQLTAISDPDGDGSVHITGLPLGGLHDFLTDVAVVEAAVFTAVLLLAGVLGTFWVRFALRPLRRVAVTATQVAELPLESGEVSLPAGVPDTDPGT
jgi:two-component system OmpR family sensor kinase